MIQIETYTIDKSIFVAVIGILMKNRKIKINELKFRNKQI